jgi:alginate O-acetyltransferase complex protein AlgI
MTLAHILIFALLSILVGRLPENRTRSWILFIASLLAVFVLQPVTSLRQFDFWLPLATIALTLLTWFVIRERSPLASEDRNALIVVVAVILAISITRVLPRPVITTTYPPQIQYVLLALILVAVIVAAVAAIRHGRFGLIPATIGFIVLMFVILKSETLQLGLSRTLRNVIGQSPELASRVDIVWLGFSYIAFRLIHTLRDCAARHLQSVSFREYLTYVLFYPALTAGPIGRLEHFVDDLRQFQRLTPARFARGGKRIAIGMLKKFILADSLAILALNEVSVMQVDSRLWLWLLLYAFAFRIYLDFSGYTDLAIGIGTWAGIDLPENFERSYLQTDIRAFWNRWHITLTEWFRLYVFNPLTRWMRTTRLRLPVWAIICLGQFITMILIGMWHGIAWHFLLWGLWHAVGLFVHNRWETISQKFNPQVSALRDHAIWRAIGVFFTYNYVALGWVWFAIPNADVAFNVLRKLTGL